MPDYDCPFDSTCFAQTCPQHACRTEERGTPACAHRQTCESLKTLLKRDPDRSITLAKDILLNGLPLHSHLVDKYLR